MKTCDMAKENNFVLRESVKAAQMGYFDHLAAGGKRDPAEERWIEALTAGADAITQVTVLESRLAQVERERDAAVHDLRLYSMCKPCKHFVDGATCPMKDECDYASVGHFEWRGVCPENTKEDTKE